VGVLFLPGAVKTMDTGKCSTSEMGAYLRRSNDFAIPRLHKGAARSAKKRSGTVVIDLAMVFGLERDNVCE